MEGNGGVEITDTGLADHIKGALQDMERMEARIGWLGGDAPDKAIAYPDGTNIAYVAAIQEFGCTEKNIPPRPFISTTISTQKDKWADMMADGAGEIIDGDQTVAQVLDKVAFVAEGDVAKKITEIVSPPLAAATIAARLAKLKDKTVTQSLTKPLIDTGLMLDSLSHTVKGTA